MFGNIFTTVIINPIFNLLVFIYAILPGHNFGLAIIIFTIIVRLAMWPLVKKQINHAKAMRELTPEIKKIKQAAKGDRQKESQMTMEIYKEREINPFASIGILLVQLPIIIGLYSGLNRIIKDPQQIIESSYPFMHHLSWMKVLAGDIHKFDDSLLGFISLSRKAIGPLGVYWPAMVIVALAAIAQYFQSKQLMPQSEDSRSLKQILREAGQGRQADQSEVNAALPLYWLTTSVVAYLQQARILKEDITEADAAVKSPKALTKSASNQSKTNMVGGLKVTRVTLGDSKPKAKKTSGSKRGNKRRRK
jgi:YidC/Oxa1 family membrane protein insertase